MVMPVIQYAPEECAWCNGTGKFGAYNDICLVCAGQGSVMVAQPARNCPHCNGGGAVSVGDFEDRCKVCGGTGWSHVYKQGSGSL